MVRVLWLKNTVAGVPPALSALPGIEVRAVPQYDAALDSAAIVIVPMHADQRDLAAREREVAAVLARGAALVVNGHIAHPFLPQLSPFRASKGRGLAALRLERAIPHPLFQDVPLDVLNFTRGVAGFYARGGNPAPANATVIHTVGPGRLPVDWLWRSPAGGRLFVHSGNDIVPFLARANALERFMRWLAQC